MGGGITFERLNVNDCFQLVLPLTLNWPPARLWRTPVRVPLKLHKCCIVLHTASCPFALTYRL